MPPPDIFVVEVQKKKNPHPGGDISQAPTPEGNLYAYKNEKTAKSLGHRGGGKRLLRILLFTLTLTLSLTPSRGRCLAAVLGNTLGLCAMT